VEFQNARCNSKDNKDEITQFRYTEQGNVILQEISSKEKKPPEMTLQTLGGLVVRERGKRPKQRRSQYKIQDNIKRSNELPVCFVMKCSPFDCLLFPFYTVLKLRQFIIMM
jgi:hypothetical protein